MSWRSKPPVTVSAFGRTLLAHKAPGATLDASALPVAASPLPGEGGRKTTRRAFDQANCAIWNDIARALGAKSEQSK